MDRTSHEPTRRYLMIELSCDQMQCKPCTYPNCQRFVRQTMKSKKLAATITPIALKELEINATKDSELKRAAEVPYPHHVNRYILTELSCSEAKCSPCTYPNCQRFVRSRKATGKTKTPVVSVTELRGDKHVKAMIAGKE